MAHKAGVLITLDELQLASPIDLGDFAATLQQHVPDAWPLVVIVAGLPSIRSTHRGVTYFERAEWHVLGMLDLQASKIALQEPALLAGRPMSDTVARLLAEASGGYPYAIQLLGHHAWRASSGATHTVGKSVSVSDGEGWMAGLVAADLALLDVNGKLDEAAG